MRRGSFFSTAFRYPQLYGLRGLAERPTCGPFRFRAVQRRSWGSVACALPSQFAPLVGRRFRVSATPGPRAVRSACPCSDRFRRAIRCAALCIGDARQTRRIEDMADRDFRASLPSRVRLILDHEPNDGSILPWALSSCRVSDALAFDRDGHIAAANAQSRGLDTAGDSLAPGPLVADPSAPGFAAPFLRRCVPK
jgi:hypothetical protein